MTVSVLGCADVTLPASTWSERDGDTLVIHCNNTQEVWYLVCQHKEWQGYLGNCTVPTVITAAPTSDDEEPTISIGKITVEPTVVDQFGQGEFMIAIIL